MPNGANINSITFDGTNSTNNEANIFIDDVKVWNEVPAAIEKEKPIIKTDSAELSYGNVRVGDTKSLKINILGMNLTSDITINITDTAEVFTLTSPSSIPNIIGDSVKSVIDVEFKPTRTGAYGGTLTIASGDTSVTVQLTGTGYNTTDVYNTPLVELKVYPNPIYNGQLIIDKGQVLQRERVEIFNASGILVGIYFINEEQTIISLSSLPNGIYLVRIGGKVARVLKQ
jgi:hypothetical protein